MKENLGTIEWKVYNFIKERSEKGLWTKQKDIQESVKDNNNVDIGFRQIRKYVSNIRKNDVIQKVILTSYAYGYRLMTDEEQFLTLERRKISLLKSLKQYYKDVRRLNKDNQLRITFTPYERDIIESLLKIENDENKKEKNNNN